MGGGAVDGDDICVVEAFYTFRKKRQMDILQKALLSLMLQWTVPASPFKLGGGTEVGGAKRVCGLAAGGETKQHNEWICLKVPLFWRNPLHFLLRRLSPVYKNRKGHFGFSLLLSDEQVSKGGGAFSGAFSVERGA